jgi:uncharacterized membrane protein YidH (DUF202 family)
MTPPDRAAPDRPAPDRPAPDRGAAAERTRLAWRRTTLAVTAITLLIARMATLTTTLAVGLVGLALALAGWVAAIVLAHRRITDLGRGQPLAAVRRSPAVLALFVAWYALIGALLIAGGAGR